MKFVINDSYNQITDQNNQAKKLAADYRAAYADLGKRLSAIVTGYDLNRDANVKRLKERLEGNILAIDNIAGSVQSDYVNIQASKNNTELEKYGFTMSDEAWQGFHSRIAEEKRDGKFYGVNTVRKVVKELLYKKQLSNARGGKSDTNITLDDSSQICVSLLDSAISGYDMLDNMISGNTKRRIFFFY